MVPMHTSPVMRSEAQLSRSARRPKLIYLVTEDWYFWSHRLPMAEAARAAGFDVAVACRVDRHGDRLRAQGLAVHPLNWTHLSLDPVELLNSFCMVASLYRRPRPDIVLPVALKHGEN